MCAESTVSIDRRLGALDLSSNGGAVTTKVHEEEQWLRSNRCGPGTGEDQFGRKTMEGPKQRCGVGVGGAPPRERPDLLAGYRESGQLAHGEAAMGGVAR